MRKKISAPGIMHPAGRMIPEKSAEFNHVSGFVIKLGGRKFCSLKW